MRSSSTWVRHMTPLKLETIIELGTHDNNDPEFISRVSKIDLHPEWDDNGGSSQVLGASDSAVDNIYNINRKHNDQCINENQILTLTEAVEFSRTVKPVCLPTDPSQSYLDKEVTATGWGLLGDGSVTNKLMEVDVRVISIEKCRTTTGYGVTR